MSKNNKGEKQPKHPSEKSEFNLSVDVYLVFSKENRTPGGSSK